MSEQSPHIHLFTGSFIEIQRLQLDLNDAEIPFLIKDNNQSARMAGFGSLSDAVEIFVFENDFEAASEIINLAKDKFNIKTLYAITLPINKPSIHLLEKLGLSYQKTVKPFEDDKELLLFVKNL